MKPVDETNLNTWTPQVWQGNPELNLQCACKYFINPNNGKKVPVYVFGGTKEYPGLSFCVSAGKASDWSYTGSTQIEYDIYAAQNKVDQLAETKKLFK